MDPAQTALVALAVSLAVAGWQLVKHFLDGPRIRVKLRPGLLGDYTLQASDTWSQLTVDARNKGGWHVEVALIEVENGGRAAVTVIDAGLDLGKGHVLRPELLKAGEARAANRVRLEPFDRVQFIVELWQGLGAVVDARSETTQLRATIRVAGRRRLRQSPRRLAWNVRAGQLTFSTDPLEVGMETYRAIWRQTRRGVTAPLEYLAIPIALAIRTAFPLGGQRQPLQTSTR